MDGLYGCLILILFVCDIGFCGHEKKNSSLEVWTIPSVCTSIGSLFVYKVPAAPVERKTDMFKAFSGRNNPLPDWLNFNEQIGLFEGVPLDKDLGENDILVTALDDNLNALATVEFSLQVMPGVFVSDQTIKDVCAPQEEKTIIVILLEAEFHHLTSQERVNLLKKSADLLGISPLSIKISEQEQNDAVLSDSVLAAGPGNAKRLSHKKSSVILLWQVGCNGNLWANSIDKLELVKNLAKDGELSNGLGHPVIGWRLVKDDSKRWRRETLSSSEVSNGIDEDYIVPERVVMTDSATPVFGPELSPTFPAPTSVFTQRHHRHNHGYLSVGQSHRLYRSIPLSDGLEPLSSQASIGNSMYIENNIDYSRDIEPSQSVISPSPSLSLITQETDITEPVDELWSFVDVGITEGPTPPLPSAVSPTNDFVFEHKNSPPEILNRIQKLRVTAGKVLRYQLLNNTFFDREDGYSRNLSLTFRTAEGDSLTENSWIQFDEKALLIYGLPLDEQVSRWDFVLSAVDSGSLSVNDSIEVTVQHHKGKRTVNHAVHLQVLKVPPGPAVNWQLSLIEGINLVFPNSDEPPVTVLSVNTSLLPYLFSFTNDSLPKTPCPREDIENIVKTLSAKLRTYIEPDIVIGTIKWEGKGHCEARTPEASLPSNFPPVMRNQVDHLNATVGQLLVYTVPDDTFFDQEDGSSRNMKLSLVTMDLSPISSHNWLQFDDKNQEFYGIPMPSNTGQTEYLLQCEDSGGLRTSDSLVVTVLPAPKTMYNVEFSMKLNVDYEYFNKTPSMQRDFVQRLSSLFGDENTNAIVLSGISPGSTDVTWHNKTLPTTICPDTHILLLRQIMLGDDEKITPAVFHALEPEFPVLSAKLTPTGICQGSLTSIFTDIGVENSTSDVTAISHGEQYIIGLVIPSAVIAVMLLCAGFVACILYRRKRTGKMSVGDEDERQSFRSKGIPVIFQDELDERPEPSNKSPIIMKEEKPPLPPPEYQRGPPLATTALLSDTEDTPYQPPPPFTTSRDSARPKPTPTYRMPPPYVPP